jgi:hypothetical protein
VLEVGLSAVVGLSTLLGWWFYLHYHVNGGGGDRGPHPVEFYRIKAACGSHKKKRWHFEGLPRKIYPNASYTS